MFLLKRDAIGCLQHIGHDLQGRQKHFRPRARLNNLQKAKLSEGLKVTAGTLNPHLPIRRLVLDSEIEKWIEEKE